MGQGPDITVLCLASYFKGEAFLRTAKQEGCRVFLLTEEKLRDEMWPRENIDDVFLMPDLSKTQDVINAASYLCRSHIIDLLIPLDEFDVENVAALREHLRIPGMGQTMTRNFRDKLVMREVASAKDIRVPAFVPVINYDRLREFMGRVTPPWVLKPRTEAGTMGIKKLHQPEELWRWLDQLGDRQSYFVLEQFIPGDVFHVDSIVWNRKVVFASAQAYGQPPMNVAHEGGIFSTRTLPPDSQDTQALLKLNAEVIAALGLDSGVAHAEYIRAQADRSLYFLEIAARVGGAHISDLLEHARGVNPWSEWARLEIAHQRGQTYTPPKAHEGAGGLLVCLARQEHPDLTAYNDPEIAWRINKRQHAGLIVTSPDYGRVQTLLDNYTQRFAVDFLAVAPPKEGHTA